MEGDQVKYSDLIADDVVKGFELLDKTLKGLQSTMASLKDEADGVKSVIKGMGSANRDQQQEIARLAAEVERLKNQMKGLKDEEKKVTEIKRQYKKLTDEQIQAVNAFQQALRGSTAQQLAAVNAIDVESKSYNELNAMYNALKDSLNAMTIAERQNTEAGKAMTVQSAKIYDTMNELQKATGKYTLQVGKYRAAFDGLGYSIQQVIREAPSALNLNQFFLAISNNIPMVVDQFRSFKKEQNEIKENLSKMTKGTAEYEEQQGKMMSTGKKIWKSIWNWQTAVIAVLMVIRQINFDKIWNGIKKLIGATKDWWSETRAVRNEMNAVKYAVENSVMNVRSELEFLLNDLKNAKKGTKEWENILYRIEEITGKTLDHTNNTASAVEEVTKAYIEQLKQIETNKAVLERYGALTKKKYALERIFSQGGDQSLLSWITGIDDNKKEEIEEGLKGLKDAMNEYGDEVEKIRSKMLKSGLNDDQIDRYFSASLMWAAFPSGSQQSWDAIGIMNDIEKSATGNLNVKEIADLSKKIVDHEGDIEEGLREIMWEWKKNEKVLAKSDSVFNELYKAMPTGFVKGNNAGSGASGSFDSSYQGVSMADVLKAEADAMKDKGNSVLEEIQLWYDKKTQIAEASYEKEIADLEKEKDKRNESLEENLLKAKDFIARYNNIVAKLDKEHSAGRLKDDEWTAQKNKLAYQYQEANKFVADAENERIRIGQYYAAMEKAALKKKENELSDIAITAGKNRVAERVKTHETELKTRWAVFNQEVRTEREKAEEEKKIAIDLAEFKLKVAEESGFYTVEEIAEMRENLKKLRAELKNIGFKYNDKEFKTRQDAEKRRFELEKHNAIERAKFNMEQEMASKQWQIDHAKELKLSEAELAILKEEVEWLQKKYNQGNYNAKRGNTGNYANIWEVLGIDMDSNQVSALNSVFDQAKAALNSWMDARKAAADQAKELADDEVSAAENALNREIELRNQGYANDVALKERELADAKERQKKALEMQKKAKEEELALNTAMEASSMAVAIANLFKQFPIYVAIPLAATLLGAFSYAKLSALSQIRSTKYREGGVMMLEGGSHESGHDVNLGIGPDGSNLRAEGGEYFAVINKRSSRKYGSQIPDVVNALNSGMFEDRYIKTSDAVGLLPRVIRADNGSEVDLSAVESGVGQLVKQGESRWSVEGEYRVERYKNRVRRVKIG